MRSGAPSSRFSIACLETRSLEFFALARGAMAAWKDTRRVGSQLLADFCDPGRMEVSECTLGANTAGNVADLTRRIMAGDRQAEAELVELYSRGVSFIIRREAGAEAIAEDLAQEVFRIALEKIRHGDVREPEKLSGFLSSLARNLVIEHFRRFARQESLTLDEDSRQIPDPAPSPLEELLRKEKSRIARQTISELNSCRDRQVIFRFYIAEEEKERICKDLGLTSLHFNRVLFRARERYRELYEKATGGKR